jgi:hypothetical protein
VSALAEHLAKAPGLVGHHILVLDIERFKGRAEVEFWSLADFKNRRLPADAVVEWPRTICLAWRFYGTKRVEFAAEWEPGGREAMLLAAWEAYDRADIVVGHNVAAFDTKHLNAEWRDMGLMPPSPFKTVDTLKEARKHFGDESKQLASLTQRLGIETKTDKYDVEVARAALAGHVPSQRKLANYNKGDVVASEALYDAFRGWMPNHPHVKSGNALDVVSCNQCASRSLSRNGIKLASQITYLLYRCDDCGANVQGTRHSRAAITRGAA